MRLKPTSRIGIAEKAQNEDRTRRGNPQRIGLTLILKRHNRPVWSSLKRISRADYLDDSERVGDGTDYIVPSLLTNSVRTTSHVKDNCSLIY